MSLKKFYAGFANPSYLHSNIEKTTNVSPEFFSKFDNYLLYYVDRDGTYKDDPLYLNLDDTFYPLTCVDNPAMYPGLYIETKLSRDRPGNYKVSDHNIASLMERYPRFIMRKSQRYNLNGKRCGFETIRELHEPSYFVVSIRGILAQQMASKDLLKLLE